jgi:hypothetical protein
MKAISAPARATLQPLRAVDAGVLEVAYYEAGPADASPVFLMHGFPYDIHSYVEVAPRLAARSCRVIVPYLRGYGPTRFLDPQTPRSGEQAALGADLRALMDALGIRRAVLAGYDWGGRAACVVAAFRSTATTSRTSPEPCDPTCRRTSTGSGTSTFSTANAGAPRLPRIGARSAACCGGCGRRAGASTMQPSRKARRPSTTPISSTS